MKIVIIGQQGNGTNLFRELCNSHKDIHFYNELFLHDGQWEVYQDTETIQRFLDKMFEKRNEKVVGFDLKYNQITEEILEYIDNNNFCVFHMFRDPARTFFKNHSKSDSFTMQQVKQYVNNIRQQEQKISKRFPNAFEFTYERMTQGKKIDKMSKNLAKEILCITGLAYQELFCIVVISYQSVFKKKRNPFFLRF